MVNIVQQPQGYNFAGNLSDLAVMSDRAVEFTIDGLLEERYEPDASGRVVIPLRAFFETHLHAPGLDEIPAEGLPIATYTYRIDSEEADTCCVLPGGVAAGTLDTELFLYSNFLTWQHQTEGVITTMDTYGFRVTEGDKTYVELDTRNGLNIPGRSQITLGRSSRIDMPGVLAAGRVRANGNKGYLWGCKSNGIGVSTHVGGVAGKYRINHHLGHTNYMTTATAVGTINGYELVATIVDETADYVEIWILDEKTPRESDFNFVIIGDK